MSQIRKTALASFYVSRDPGKCHLMYQPVRESCFSLLQLRGTRENSEYPHFPTVRHRGKPHAERRQFRTKQFRCSVTGAYFCFCAFSSHCPPTHCYESKRFHFSNRNISCFQKITLYSVSEETQTCKTFNIHTVYSTEYVSMYYICILYK